MVVGRRRKLVEQSWARHAPSPVLASSRSPDPPVANILQNNHRYRMHRVDKKARIDIDQFIAGATSTGMFFSPTLSMLSSCLKRQKNLVAILSDCRIVIIPNFEEVLTRKSRIGIFDHPARTSCEEFE